MRVKCDARMTLNEVLADLRSRGFSIGVKTLSDGIQQGAFPFGRVVSVSEHGIRNILILRKDYESWADEYVGPVITPA